MQTACRREPSTGSLIYYHLVMAMPEQYHEVFFPEIDTALPHFFPTLPLISIYPIDFK
jgi:hypothetical protein